MGFIAPWMLFGAAAVSIPIALHFFFRSRYRVVPWAAMKFLLLSIEQTSRRLKFQELLLLILRCLVLATLALAMARPTTTTARGTGRGDAVDAIFLMDVSYSMGADDGPKTRLQRAKDAAMEVIEKLPAHSTVRIVTASTLGDYVGPVSPGNLDTAREMIKQLELTSLSTDLAPAVAEAAKLLKECQLPNKEIYLFSDMQKSGWEAQPSAIKKDWNDIKDKASVFMVRCGTRMSPTGEPLPPRNAEIVGITPQVGVPRPGERTGFAVLVRNTGSEALSDVVVTLGADGGIPGQEDKEKVETQTIATLQPGETRPVTLMAKFEKAGPRVLTARIKQASPADDVPGDNRFDQVIPVREAVNVLVVNGAPNERTPDKSSSFFLNHALLPIKDTDRGKYYLQIREVEPRLATRALLEKTDIVFLVNCDVAAEQKQIDAFGKRNVVPADFITDLGTWVKQGRGLIIIPGTYTNKDRYNAALKDLMPMPIVKLHEVDEKKFTDKEKDKKEKPVRISRLTFSLPAFMKFKEDTGYFAGFDLVQAAKYFELDESKEKKPAGSEVVLRYDNGKAAIASRKIDRGEVFMFTTSTDKITDPAWSDWWVSPNFVPLMQTLFAHLLQEQSQSLNSIAGQPMTYYPQDKDRKAYLLVEPTGKEVPLDLPKIEAKRPVLGLPLMTEAGVYRLMPRLQKQDKDSPFDAKGVPIAVIPDLRESQDFDALTNEQIDGRLGFKPTHVTADQGTAENTGTFDRFQREWTLWILMLVLVLMVGESTLAWLCGRAW